MELSNFKEKIKEHFKNQEILTFEYLKEINVLDYVNMTIHISDEKMLEIIASIKKKDKEYESIIDIISECKGYFESELDPDLLYNYDILINHDKMFEIKSNKYRFLIKNMKTKENYEVDNYVCILTEYEANTDEEEMGMYEYSKIVNKHFFTLSYLQFLRLYYIVDNYIVENGLEKKVAEGLKDVKIFKTTLENLQKIRYNKKIMSKRKRVMYNIINILYSKLFLKMK
jgi:hypothetical protein